MRTPANCGSGLDIVYDKLIKTNCCGCATWVILTYGIRKYGSITNGKSEYNPCENRMHFGLLVDYENANPKQENLDQYQNKEHLSADNVNIFIGSHGVKSHHKNPNNRSNIHYEKNNGK